MPASDDALSLLRSRFGPNGSAALVSVPGRVNLIGEHIDYHDLPVLPMGIQRRIWIAFRARNDSRIHAISDGAYGEREFHLSAHADPGLLGDWANYLRAAAHAVNSRWSLTRGIDAAITSNLPPAAGLSSSSALLVGFTIALLDANNISATFDELMEILPEGEQQVGTRGGGMDHAAVLGCREGCALLVNFAPLELSPIPIPGDWSFIIAHSLTTAEKSGAMRSEYNGRRSAGIHALKQLGFASYRSAIETHSKEKLTALATQKGRGRLSDDEMRCFLHVVTENLRVEEAVAALRDADASVFGKLLSASHASLRDQLRVSSPALDSLVEIAHSSGALGARLTGAGFGGCVVILCKISDCERIRTDLVKKHYSRHTNFDPENHIIIAEPSSGAALA
ncbi:MAG: galactokinase [Bryobacteraceae bacterium]